MNELRFCNTCQDYREFQHNVCLTCGNTTTYQDLVERIQELMEITNEQFETIDMLNDALQASKFILGTIRSFQYHTTMPN